MTTPPAPPRRRRHRRGSVERPVSGRLYRASFLVLGLPLLALAFSVTRPGALPGPQLPPNLDGGATQELAAELSTFFPDRTPGGPDSLRAANWVRGELAGTGLTVRVDAWRARVPGLGRTVLRNVSATVPGQSPKAIVVLAHRDDLGEGPGANDDATGTAALIELARSYAQASSPGTTGVRSAHTIIFLSTDAGAFGGIGAVRFANRHRAGIVAVIALSAIGGHEPPRLVIAGDTPRSPPGVLVETAAARVLGQSGTRVRRPSLVSQLLDLAFP
jgi:hypothetical protein